MIQAHLADAIPVDVLKSEQDRVRKELASVQRQLGLATTKFDALKEALKAAIELAGRCGEAYSLAGESSRRQFNQAIEVAPPTGFEPVLPP